jgi:DNA-binding NtrC family response regulator
MSILKNKKNWRKAKMVKDAKTVLIIDDDKSITRTFARILQKNGYATDTAQTGKEAMQKANAKFYAVALIDICLPDLNGIKLLDKLADHGNKMVKIIITGFPTMAPIKGVDADAYLLKPVKPQELLSIINEKTKEN